MEYSADLWVVYMCSDGCGSMRYTQMCPSSCIPTADHQTLYPNTLVWKHKSFSDEQYMYILFIGIVTWSERALLVSVTNNPFEKLIIGIRCQNHWIPAYDNVRYRFAHISCIETQRPNATIPVKKFEKLVLAYMFDINTIQVS